MVKFDPPALPKFAPACARLNGVLAARGTRWLAAPALAGGVPVSAAALAHLRAGSDDSSGAARNAALGGVDAEKLPREVYFLERLGAVL